MNRKIENYDGRCLAGYKIEIGREIRNSSLCYNKRHKRFDRRKLKFNTMLINTQMTPHKLKAPLLIDGIKRLSSVKTAAVGSTDTCHFVHMENATPPSVRFERVNSNDLQGVTLNAQC